MRKYTVGGERENGRAVSVAGLVLKITARRRRDIVWPLHGECWLDGCGRRGGPWLNLSGRFGA